MKCIEKKLICMFMVMLLMNQTVYVSAQDLEVNYSNVVEISVSGNDYMTEFIEFPVLEDVDKLEDVAGEKKDEPLDKEEWVVDLEAALEVNKEAGIAEVIINETNFPDEIFREYVEMNFDNNSDGLLSISEIEQTTIIAVADKGIIDLEGIEYFIMLEVLECYNNQISTLDISACVNLERLYCYNNELSTLDVTGCTNLTLLGCYDNELSTLDVSNCSDLTWLYCHNNGLSTLNVSGCTNLKWLYCDNNNLRELDVSGCTNLTYFECYSNKLSTLNISNCTNLAILYCYDNELSALDVSDYSNLTRLYCYNNELNTLEVSGCTSLTDLICQDNNLSILDISSCTNLTRFYCHNNELSTLDTNSCTKLAELSCQDNKLSILNVSSCTNLTNLKCYNNELNKLEISSCKKLKTLDCGYNKLSTLDISTCTKLIDLTCSGNELRALDVSGCKDLGELYCSYNELSILDVSDHTYLRYLYCHNNKLSTLDVSGCRNLNTLECFDNELGALDVSGFTKLEWLFCYNNKLSALDVSGCLSLVAFYCYNNDLCALDVSESTKLMVHWNFSDNVYLVDAQTVDITTLPGFAIDKVVSGFFTNGLVKGNILTPIDISKTVFYKYNVGRFAPVEFGIKFLPSIDYIFNDISANAWYKTAVQFVYDNGIMSGKGNGKFDPSGDLTRAEFAATLYSMEGQPKLTYKSTFNDVPNGEWYTSPVLWASQIGIASGYGNGKFGVSDSITREQLAMMMYKYATEVRGYESEITEGVLFSFSDADKVSNWAVKAMEWAVTNGIISGTGDNRLNPQGNALRCECAQILNKVYEFLDY